MTKAVKVVITGRVQGVAYRAWCQTEAMTLGISGWVRNRRDGSVEAVFTGEADQVDDMLARLREGPPGADVTNVAAIDADPVDSDGFSVLPTA